MKKVRYIPTTTLMYNVLTPYKVYDVINYELNLKLKCHVIYILDDSGIKNFYFFSIHDVSPVFIDATSEYRNEIIDEILE